MTCSGFLAQESFDHFRVPGISSQEFPSQQFRAPGIVSQVFFIEHSRAPGILSQVFLFSIKRGCPQVG